MRASFDPAVEEFRGEVREYLRAAMAPERTEGHADAGDLTGLDEKFERTLQRDAGAHGYLALTLPAAYGGGERSTAYRAAFSLEAAAFDAPLIDTALTLGGAPILAYGSDEQRATLLPAMARGETTLCIAYSEADAGSDLTGIATTARADDDGWRIDGTKVLVTGAHKADWCLLVARTDPDPDAAPRDAMTMFLVEIATPGISVHRTRTANRWTLADLVFEDVHVPRSAVLGAVGRGFAQMAAAIADERSGFFWVGWAQRRLDDLVALVRGDECATPAERRCARDTVARLWIDVALAHALARRVVDAQEQGVDTTVLASMSKVFVTELLQRIASAGVALLGPRGLVTSPLFGPDDPDAAFHGRFAYEVVERLHPTISVGSNEIQRDVIAHRGLGLPSGQER
jgi:alkylation response protein AidB-like acyl-CoA dehydrogenase